MSEFLKELTNKDHGSNGYQRLPGGLIIQWGVKNSSASGAVTVTFPIPFPNAVCTVNVNPVTANANFANPDNIGLASFPLSAYTHDGSRISLGCRWVAIGY